MALVSGRRSSLNPDAPLFIPAALRQVEDFSPEWWQLVTSSTWYHDYWLSQQQEDMDGFEFDDIADLLPDSCDIDTDEDFMNQYEEFIRSGTEATLSTNGGHKEVMAMNGEAMKKNMKLVTTSHGGAPKLWAEPAKYPEKVAKRSSPRYSPRSIQQPR